MAVGGRGLLVSYASAAQYPRKCKACYCMVEGREMREFHGVPEFTGVFWGLVASIVMWGILGLIAYILVV